MFENITNGSFEIEKTIHYTLSIQVSLDGFSFVVFDSLNNCVVAHKTTPLKISSENLIVRHLKDWLESESILKKHFGNIRIFVFTETFTLIPEDFSNDISPEILNSLLFSVDAKTELNENKITDLNARLVFPVQSDLNGLLNQFFYNSVKEILHPVSVVLSKPIEHKKKNKAVIITTRKFFYLVIFRNGKLLLSNSFQYLQPADLVYNVLNSFNVLKTSRNETELFVFGAIQENTEIENLLQPHFNHISKLKTSQCIENHENLNETLQLFLSII